MKQMTVLSDVARRFRILFATLLVCAGIAAAQAQTFNCYEGNGVLENAWADWSWCQDNLKSTTFLYQGPYSIQITYTGGWQGFSLNSSTPFPAGYFSALTFFINGGTIAGRSIQVSLVVNGSQTASLDLKKYIAGGSVGAKSWRSVSVPLAAFGLKTTDLISRFTLQESTGKAQPAFWISQIGWTPVPPPATTIINVNAATVNKTIDQKMFGVNTAVWDGGFTTTTCKNLMAKSGFKAFRFPGGSLSDGYHWATDTSDSNTWTWATNFDDWATVAVPTTQGQCFITVNYGTGTAAEAAAWVKYSNVTKHYGMKYWEVGNENFGSWEEDAHARPNDPVIYATQFAAYSKQMKLVDPSIKVGAVAVAGEDSYANYSDEVVTNPRTHANHSGWTAVMLSTMAKLGVAPDFLAYHSYPEWVVDCDFTLLNCTNTWAADMASMRQQLNDYLGSKASQTQLMCTENNADAGTPGKQLCSVVNGLYMADSFGTLLHTECNSYMWWDFLNGTDTNPSDGPWLYGWRLYGDEGVISPDFTQTYPVYYMEQLFNQFAAAGDQVVWTSSSYNLLPAYGTKRADGTLRLMVINKNPTTVISAKLALSNFSAPSTVTTYAYGIAQDNLAKNGLPQSISTSTAKFTTTTTFQFPPYSVTVLAFGPQKAGAVKP